MSWPVESRWFRHAGGVPPMNLAEPTGRYLSFSEGEELALLDAQGLGVRAIARDLGRDPGTISRELRRSAATRSGETEYRAGVAHWKAQTAARRPKPGKLITQPAADGSTSRYDFAGQGNRSDPTAARQPGRGRAARA